MLASQDLNVVVQSSAGSEPSEKEHKLTLELVGTDPRLGKSPVSSGVLLRCCPDRYAETQLQIPMRSASMWTAASSGAEFHDEFGEAELEWTIAPVYV